MVTNIYLEKYLYKLFPAWNLYFVVEEEEDMKVICSFLKRHTRYSRLI